MQHDEAQMIDAQFKTRYGEFRLIAFAFPSGRSHAVLVKGDLASDPHPLVRLQSACLTSMALEGVGCDCKDQLDLAMQLIADEGVGCVVYLDQEGMGHGLYEKVAHYKEMNNGADTVEAAIRRGVEPDIRDYEEAAAILKHLVGDRPIRLLTNNPEKVARARRAGIAIHETLNIEPDPTDANREYLRVKKVKLHHRLTKV